MKNSLYYILRRYFGIRVIALQSLVNEYFNIVRYMGSTHNLYENKAKLRARIIMNAHSIEKGLSLKNIKLGYGKNKILLLLKDVDHYYNTFYDETIVVFCTSIIKDYIEYNKSNGLEDKEILEAFSKTNIVFEKNKKNKREDYLDGGCFKTSREKIHRFGKIDYSNFVKNRHSIRNFTGNKISIELIESALEIAEYTPSACNRQPWGVYVFLDDKKIKTLLDLQTGARQFKNDISCAILVTSNYSSFFGYEHHQPYVNGGMYAMNLIFALHSLGVGTTPLNMGLSTRKLKDIGRICDIKRGEVPILLIGVGEISEELSIATSCRFRFNEYTKYY